MMNTRVLLLLIFSFLLVQLSFAQQDKSKSKSSDKIYEKGEEDVLIENAVLINTSNLEFAPAFYQNGIVYVTSRHKSGSVDEKIGETFFELFYAELNRNGHPLKPVEFSVNINSQVHEGPVTFDRQGDNIYFTRNNMKNGIRKADSKGVSRLKIYEARKGRFDWEDVRELPFNNDEYSVCHPSLSADGRRLYFTSDMPGGYGGFDLYMVEKRGNTWSVPINLGGDINTRGNEVFPFIHESGMLFFSSDGHQGFGGLDIFTINLSDPSWGKVINMKSPFNSGRDDLGLILNPEGTYGFFTSDRENGYGKDDIFRFELPNGLRGIEKPKNLTAQIIAYDAASNERIPNAEIRIFERAQDGFVDDAGYYDIQLMPSESNGGELNLKFSRKNNADLGDPTTFTNQNGEAYYSMKSDKSYLVLATKNGFESAELIYSTAGEFGPQTVRVAMKSSNCIQITGRVKIANLRSTVPYANVRIVNNTTRQEDVVKASAKGTFEYCISPNADYTIYADKEGFSSGSTLLPAAALQDMTNRKNVSVSVEVQPIADAIIKEPIRKGSVIILENIYYDFNKSAIRAGVARELDALVALMKEYPSMEIEMIAHTDARGSREYNLDLSQRRAESAKNYLVSQGIEGRRIQTVGRGENELRNRCQDGVDCTEEEHQYNRRTEVRVANMKEEINLQYKEMNPFGEGKN